MQGSRNKFILFLKGMAMGMADVVPGVSGGTIAFITNIYATLIESIQSIGPKTLSVWRHQGFAAAWQSINGNFLAVLFLGIATSIFSLAKGITFLLEKHPVLVWSFFFGLIIVSAVYVGRQIERWSPWVVAAMLIAAVAAWQISGMTPTQVEATPWMIFGSGAVAICAMILPGISGSFILLMLGMYTHVLGAIKSFDIGVLLLFGAGCVIGILSFSRLLNWLLKHYHGLTMAILTGFMLGSLNKVWPWKNTLSFRTNSHGDQVPLLQENVLPAQYAELVADPQLLPAVLLMVAAILLVVILEVVALKSKPDGA